VLDRIINILRNNGFTPLDWDCWSDEKSRTVMVVELEECSLPTTKDFSGPPYYTGDRVNDYIAKHVSRGNVGPWIRRDGTLHAIGLRKYCNPIDLLRERWEQYMVAPHLRGVEPRVSLLHNESTMKEDLKEWLSEFIVKRPAWMNCCIH
jgi:tRNA nucleotidyltransferase (CCA-adding enzyme)